MACKATIGCTVSAVISHDKDQPLAIADIQAAQEDLRYAIQQRVMKDGFIENDEVSVDDYEIPPRSMLSLFSVSGDHEDGASYDVFVWAGTPEEAAALFQKKFEPFDLPEELQVIRAPATPIPGVVDWASLERIEFQLEEISA